MKKIPGLLIVIFLAGQASLASARPLYFKVFEGLYMEDADEAFKNAVLKDRKKCGVCHGKKKKVRNDYGKALGKLTGENNKKKDEIEAALKKVAGQKPEGGEKTYGEMLTSGELPKAVE